MNLLKDIRKKFKPNKEEKIDKLVQIIKKTAQNEDLFIFMKYLEFKLKLINKEQLEEWLEYYAIMEKEFK